MKLFFIIDHLKVPLIFNNEFALGFRSLVDSRLQS